MGSDDGPHRPGRRDVHREQVRAREQGPQPRGRGGPGGLAEWGPAPARTRRGRRPPQGRDNPPAMPDDREQILDALVEAWNGGRFESSVERYADPEIDFNPGLVPPGEDPSYRGPDGVKYWKRAVDDLWVAVKVEPVKRSELGSHRHLAIDHWHFEGRGGIEIEEELPTVWTFRDGLIAVVKGYTSRPEAAAALGLDLW